MSGRSPPVPVPLPLPSPSPGLDGHARFSGRLPGTRLPPPPRFSALCGTCRAPSFPSPSAALPRASQSALRPLPSPCLSPICPSWSPPTLPDSASPPCPCGSSSKMVPSVPAYQPPHPGPFLSTPLFPDTLPLPAAGQEHRPPPCPSRTPILSAVSEAAPGLCSSSPVLWTVNGHQLFSDPSRHLISVSLPDNF